MTRPFRQLRVFIASPSDCQAEREVVRHIATQDQSIATLRRRMNLSIEVFGYEDLPPDAGRPQSLINSAVENFHPDWFIFIFWHRFGSDAGYGMTGMEEEWELAQRMRQLGGGPPRMSLYFNQKAPYLYEVDESQHKALGQFQKRIFAKHEALACSFSGTDEFEQKFRAHLTGQLLELSETGRESVHFGFPDLRQELVAASQGLLSWPKTLGNNQEIDRPELNVLLERILEHETSTTLILGGPGSGYPPCSRPWGMHLMPGELPFWQSRPTSWARV